MGALSTTLGNEGSGPAEVRAAPLAQEEFRRARRAIASSPRGSAARPRAHRFLARKIAGGWYNRRRGEVKEPGGRAGPAGLARRHPEAGRHGGDAR